MIDIRFLLKTRYTNSRAFIIGIDKYKSVAPLSYAVSDAAAVRDVLVNDLGFPLENITYLTDAKATKKNILRSFAGFNSDKVEADERIFVFFAGHGHTVSGFRGEVGFLVPYDADIKDLSTLVRWDELTKGADLIRAKHMLFIMDACYGGLALTRNSSPGSTRFLKDMMLRYSRQVLTAGKADEVVADSGGPLPNHSVFTGHLIEGLRGKAFTENGILTASSLMSYVYGKVANDKNSNQTPHYGYFDGDGDFILQAPQLNELETTDTSDIDRLFVVPFSEEKLSQESTAGKIKKVKSLLANESSEIELHDYVIEEVRRFLSATNEDSFQLQGGYSQDEMIERVSKYEEASNDLALLTACMAYWSKPNHKVTLQKIFARSSDRYNIQSGNAAWLRLRWYPLVICLYCSGIAAVEAKRYDSLANVLYAEVSATDYEQRDSFLAEAIAEPIGFLTGDLFKQLPGYDRHYVPLSEHLFKTLQPKLDDILFIGKSYEKSFDEFEVLFALSVADLKKLQNRQVRGPLGRFAWKQQNSNSPPMTRILNEAKILGEQWGPIRAGLFGGNLERFNAVAEEFQQMVLRRNW